MVAERKEEEAAKDSEVESLPDDDGKLSPFIA